MLALHNGYPNIKIKSRVVGRSAYSSPCTHKDKYLGFQYIVDRYHLRIHGNWERNGLRG